MWKARSLQQLLQSEDGNTERSPYLYQQHQKKQNRFTVNTTRANLIIKSDATKNEQYVLMIAGSSKKSGLLESNGMVDEVQTTMILDTGAMHSLMLKEFAENYQFEIFKKDIKIKGVPGH
jgi:predicted aspartyl protease